jgi:predicted metal-binding membrane protein
MTTTEARPRRVTRLITAAIVLAWTVAVIAQLTGHAEQVHHGRLIEEGPLWAGLGLFVLAWQLMIVAMMLPSALPMVRGFMAVAVDQPRPAAVVAAFLGGYATVWTVFGAAAFAGDVVVHHTVDAWPWLHEHAWLIAGGTLGIAGAFQFSSLKDRCLTECRHPGAFLLRYYRRGTGAAFALGARHGLFCVGCCWALMLVMFGAGIANLWWMAALTALMVYEKTAPSGNRAVPVAGIALLTAAALVLAHPSWLPPLLGGDV